MSAFRSYTYKSAIINSMIFTKITTIMMTLALGVAKAHVHIDPNQAKPGSTFNTSFTVPHGCDGSPTVEIDVTVPPEVLSIQPAQVDGWKLDVHYRDLSKPERVNGQTINRTIANITWSGNQLAPTEKQLFGVVIQVPQVNLTESNSNVTLYFPVVQKCVNGTSLWTDTSGKGESTVEGAPEPAPS
ncbi:hypothetical protein BCR43DRAFT_559595, partial [Syncephalastrum racemosum]